MKKDRPDIDLKKLKHLFWDVEVEKVDVIEHKFFIIERVLRYGFPEDIRKIIKAYDKEDIINVITTSRNLDRKTVSYWVIHFGIPEEALRCMKRQLVEKLFY